MCVTEFTVVCCSKNIYLERKGLSQQSLKAKKDELQRLEAEVDNMGTVDDTDIAQRAQ